MKINLGRPMDKLCNPCPCSEHGDRETHYPSVFIDLDGDMAMKFPSSGIMKVRFSCESKSVNKRTEGDDQKVTSCVTLKLIEVLKMVSDTPEEKPDDRKLAEEALDRYAKEEAGRNEAEDEGY